MLFRILIGFLGYMNFSEDFKFTGERKLVEKLGKFNISTALDIGANKGQWARMVLNNTNWSVISFEPQKSAFKILEEFKNTHPKRFECYNYALGDENTETLINVHSSFTELSFINNDLNNLPLLTGRSSSTEEISLHRIDDLYSANKIKYSNVDFVKIDVEGFEYKVLLGSKLFLSEVKPRFVQIEMNWHQLFTMTPVFEFGKLLVDYDCYQIFPAGQVLHKFDVTNPIRNIYQLSNFLFVRSDTKFDFR
jgi:FkbM family methyltransferase